MSIIAPPGGNGYRQHLDSIRERTRVARSRKNTARQRFEAAVAVGDEEAQRLAHQSYDEAIAELEIGERLESQALCRIAGISED